MEDEHMNLFHMSSLLPNPPLRKSQRILYGILNFIIPGIGPVLAFSQVRPYRYSLLVIGLLQFFLSFLIIGWIWAIVSGAFMIATGITLKNNKQNQGPAVVNPKVGQQVVQPVNITLAPIAQPEAVQNEPVRLPNEYQNQPHIT